MKFSRREIAGDSCGHQQTSIPHQYISATAGKSMLSYRPQSYLLPHRRPRYFSKPDVQAKFFSDFFRLGVRLHSWVASNSTRPDTAPFYSVPEGAPHPPSTLANASRNWACWSRDHHAVNRSRELFSCSRSYCSISRRYFSDSASAFSALQ